MKNKFEKIIGREGLLLAIIPFLGTYVAFIFEVGYLSFYDVPIWLIKLDFIKIISAMAAVVSVSWLFIFAFMVLGSLKRSKKALVRGLFDPVFYFLFLGVILFLSPAPGWLWWVIGVFFLYSVTVTYTSPLFGVRKHGTYERALEQELKSEESRVKKEINLTGGAGLFGLLSFIVFLTGSFHASEKTKHWVLAGSEDRVIVELYGDYLVLKDINLKNKELGKKIYFLNIQNNSQEFISIDTGRLHRSGSRE